MVVEAPQPLSLIGHFLCGILDKINMLWLPQSHTRFDSNPSVQLVPKFPDGHLMAMWKHC